MDTQKLQAANDRKAMASPTPAISKLDPELYEIIERMKQRNRDLPIEEPEMVIVPVKPRIYGLPKKFKEKTFADIEGMPAVVSGLKTFTDSVFIHGPTGVGKTHLAIAMAKESGIREVKFITAPELLLSIRASFSGDCPENEEYLIREYTKAEMLILDDLGAEKSTDYSITTLYIIIDRRDRECRRTIITSNLSPRDIEAKLDARIASRIAGMKIVDLSRLPDYRKKRT